MTDKKDVSKARRAQNRESQKRFRQRRRQENSRLLHWLVRETGDSVQEEPRAVFKSIPNLKIVQNPVAHVQMAAKLEQPHESMQWKSPVFTSDFFGQSVHLPSLEQQLVNIQRPHQAFPSQTSYLNIGCEIENLTTSSASSLEDAFWCSSVWNAHTLLPSPPSIDISQDTSSGLLPNGVTLNCDNGLESSLTEDTRSAGPNQKLPYGTLKDPFTTHYGRKVFEDQIIELVDNLLDVHRVGVRMLFMIPDDGLVDLVNEIKRRIHVSNT